MALPLPSQRISGVTLRSIARACQSRVASRAVYELLQRELRLGVLASLPDAYKGAATSAAPALQSRPPRTPYDAKLAPPGSNAWSGTSESLVTTYRAGRITPTEVVARSLASARELSARTPSMGPLLEYADTEALKEAEAATERYRAGAPRGALDGVPFAVKEETGVRGFAKQGGTSFLDSTPCTEDATCVERLRAAGAIVLGTTMMTEYGMSPIGFNPQRTMPRNPHNTSHAAGGSSTGSAVAVAAGLMPFAMGGDGGGSIRIPAAMTGVFGLKATWGRVSRYGDIYGGSVEHLGPIATSTFDLARVLEIIGPPDARDPLTNGAPAIGRGTMMRALGRGVRGLRIGIPESEWAEADGDVARACHAAAKALESEGAVLVPLASPLLPYAASVGTLVLGLEAAASLYPAWRAHPDDISADLQTTIAALGHASAVDYLTALKLRSGLRTEMAKIFQGVDLVAYPTTTRTATKTTDAEWESGFVDAHALDAMVRYTFLANLTGLPASSAPVGTDTRGLPIGFQLIGDAWDEATVLAATAHLERIGAARVVRPAVSLEPLTQRVGGLVRDVGAR